MSSYPTQWDGISTGASFSGKPGAEPNHMSPWDFQEANGTLYFAAAGMRPHLRVEDEWNPDKHDRAGGRRPGEWAYGSFHLTQIQDMQSSSVTTPHTSKRAPRRTEQQGQPDENGAVIKINRDLLRHLRSAGGVGREITTRCILLPTTVSSGRESCVPRWGQVGRLVETSQRERNQQQSIGARGFETRNALFSAGGAIAVTCGRSPTQQSSPRRSPDSGPMAGWVVAASGIPPRRLLLIDLKRTRAMMGAVAG